MKQDALTNFLPTSVKWGLRLVAAVILGQTLFFKFTAAPESIYIFTRIGMEPLGRVGSGMMELVATILLLWPAYSAVGALLAMAVMSVALAMHLTLLGIVVQEDHGLLFGLACTVWVSSVLIFLDGRKQIPWIGSKLP